jgi:sterol desaturase/sphingolipid hydroxylase (fatty acid hydroxylase superfamily)
MNNPSIIRITFSWLGALQSYQIVSYSIIIGTALLFIILERIFPYNKGQKVLREGFFNDLALYTIAQSYILGIIIFTLVISSADTITGISRFRLFAGLPIWLQLLFFTVTHDFYIYWMHRFMHNNKYLWRLHEAHHSPRKVDWLSGSRSHAFEILINQTVEFLPIVLLGSPPEVAAYKGVISAVWGMYIHSNLNIHSAFLQFVINGPEMHRIHHTTGKGRNRNFATKLAVWDYIFSTAYRPDEKAEVYGLKTFFPDNFFKQFLYAFRQYKHSRPGN